MPLQFGSSVSNRHVEVLPADEVSVAAFPAADATVFGRERRPGPSVVTLDEISIRLSEKVSATATVGSMRQSRALQRGRPCGGVGSRRCRNCALGSFRVTRRQGRRHLGPRRGCNQARLA